MVRWLQKGAFFRFKCWISHETHTHRLDSLQIRPNNTSRPNGRRLPNEATFAPPPPPRGPWSPPFSTCTMGVWKRCESSLRSGSRDSFIHSPLGNSYSKKFCVRDTHESTDHSLPSLARIVSRNVRFSFLFDDPRLRPGLLFESMDNTLNIPGKPRQAGCPAKRCGLVCFYPTNTRVSCTSRSTYLPKPLWKRTARPE